jgi:hypothetical protein
MKPRGRSAVSSGALLLALLGALSCQRSSLATPRRAPILDLTWDRDLTEIAETRRIVFGSGDHRPLIDGWSVDEYDPSSGLTFVWATELEANVAFRMLAVVDQQFLVKVSAFAGAIPQTITVLVNDRPVSSFTAEPAFLEYRFVVPASLLRRGENRLTFRHSRLEGRADGSEPRRFAAAYNSILIGPLCLPLRGWGLPPHPRVHRTRATPSEPAALVITGPAVIRRRLRVPLEGVLRYRISLLTPEQAPAIATLRIRDGAASRDVVETRLSPSLFDRSPSRDVEVDLTPWRGKTVELEIEVEPEACRATVTTVAISRAGVYRVDESGEAG